MARSAALPARVWRRFDVRSVTEAGVLAGLLALWAAGLAAVLTRVPFLSHDSLSNNVHVWYISDQLWGHGRLPWRMPMLAGGEALAYPYAFIPWTSAALLFPVLGDWVVTLWLVLAAVAVIVLTFWALPEVRRGWLAAAVLANPALVLAVLVGQLPFLWGMAFLLAAVGCWRRHRRRAATVLAVLAMVTHAAVVAPIAALVVVVGLCLERDRRALSLHALLAGVLAAPAGLLVMLSPAFEESSPGFRLRQLLSVVLTRCTLVAVPAALAWLAPRLQARPRLLVMPVVALMAVHLGSLNQSNRDAFAAPLRSPHPGVARLVDDPGFEADATYRVLGYADERLAMYELARAGARLDSEFFPESQARHSWSGTEEYVEFLHEREVDFVMEWSSYTARYRTNERALLDALVGGTCAEHSVAVTVVAEDPSWMLFRVDRCEPAGSDA